MQGLLQPYRRQSIFSCGVPPLLFYYGLTAPLDRLDNRTFYKTTQLRSRACIFLSPDGYRARKRKRPEQYTICTMIKLSSWAVTILYNVISVTEVDKIIIQYKDDQIINTSSKISILYMVQVTI